LQNDRYVRDMRRTNLEIFNSVHLDTDCRRRANARNWRELLTHGCFLKKRKKKSRLSFAI
jgi:hypothetical protein